MRHALLFCRHDVACQHGQHRAVHGHRDRHLVERNLVEEDLHVLHRVNRYTGFAHIARHAGVVRVVATVGSQVKRDRHALPARSQGLAVEGVGFFGGGETGVLADGPGAHCIHGGLRAAQEGLEAGQRVGVRQVFGVCRGVERFDGDAIGSDPVQRIDIATGGRFGRCLGPGL